MHYCRGVVNLQSLFVHHELDLLLEYSSSVYNDRSTANFSDGSCE